MYIVRFSTPRVVAYTDPRAFDSRVQRWLAQREGENSYFLGLLPTLTAGGPRPGLNFLTVEEDGAILAACLCLADGTICMSWATPEVIDAVVDHICSAQWLVRHIHGPAHVAGYLGRAYARRESTLME